MTLLDVSWPSRPLDSTEMVDLGAIAAIVSLFFTLRKSGEPLSNVETSESCWENAYIELAPCGKRQDVGEAMA